MKLFCTSDIHQFPNKWKLLVGEALEVKPDIVCIAGDLFSNDFGIQGQLRLIPHIEKYLKKINAGNIKVVATIGNDDNPNMIPSLLEWQSQGLINFLNCSSVSIHGINFVGMHYVPDYPFAFKQWVAPDSKDNPRIHPKRLGKPCVMNDKNEFVYIDNFQEYFMNKKSIQEHLKSLSESTDMRKSVYLIHCPPAGCNLDLCGHGEHVGSQVVTDFIVETQPLLTLHGHIHESFERSGKWYAEINETLAIQAGQVGKELVYAVVEIEDGKIQTYLKF